MLLMKPGTPHTITTSPDTGWMGILIFQ